MKSRIISAAIMSTLLVAATATFAASKDVHKGSFQAADPIQVNGKKLPAGDYSVRWNGEGPNVEISILSGGRVLATATATVVDLSEKAGKDAIEVSTTGGERSLTAIRFSGKKYSLAISENSANTGQSKSKPGTN